MYILISFYRIGTILDMLFLVYWLFCEIPMFSAIQSFKNIQLWLSSLDINRLGCVQLMMFTFPRSTGVNLLLYLFWHLKMNSGLPSSPPPPPPLSSIEVLTRSCVALGLRRLYLAYMIKSSLLLQMLKLIFLETKRRNRSIISFFVFHFYSTPKLYVFSMARVVCLVLLAIW